MEERLHNLVAEIAFSSSGIAKTVELFGNYVARQLGLIKGSAVAKRLADVTMGYLAGDRSSTDHSLEGILAFLGRIGEARDLSDEEMLHLHQELVNELDSCMISYFAFHWHQASHLLDQVQDGHRSLRHVVMAATRKARFRKIMTSLKTKRTFSTLLEMLKAMGAMDSSVPRPGDVVVAADSKLRSPVLLLIGGGMGAGKSTVAKEIISGSFWSGVVHDAVVVEADAFKEADVVYRTISSSGHSNVDIALASELVHKCSTQAASSLLVAALNEGRDVVFDGTMMWEPFVSQTIAMARDVHNRRYRMGRGYVKAEDGSFLEEYWVPAEDEEDEHEVTTAGENDQEQGQDGTKRVQGRRPYRIELVGVICEPLLAVVRGIRRAIITKRAVPIKGQLRSHKLFAASLEKYCDLVDHAKIYTTNKPGEPAELIGWKDDLSRCRKLLVDPAAFQAVERIAKLNEDADNVLELYEGCPPDAMRVWNEIAFSPERRSRQEFLRELLMTAKDIGY